MARFPFETIVLMKEGDSLDEFPLPGGPGAFGSQPAANSGLPTLVNPVERAASNGSILSSLLRLYESGIICVLVKYRCGGKVYGRSVHRIIILERIVLGIFGHLMETLVIDTDNDKRILKVF